MKYSISEGVGLFLLLEVLTVLLAPWFLKNCSVMLYQFFLGKFLLTHGGTFFSKRAGCFECRRHTHLCTPSIECVLNYMSHLPWVNAFWNPVSKFYFIAGNTVASYEADFEGKFNFCISCSPYC